MSSLYLKLDPGGSIYTMEIGKCYKSGLFPKEPIVKHIPLNTRYNLHKQNLFGSSKNFMSKPKGLEHL
jgi:hypothetical protein